MKTSMRRRLTKYKKRIAIVLLALATITAALTNLDKIATLWAKYFGQPDEFESLSDAVNQALPPQFNSLVELELVQRPREQGDSQVFDVYLRNKTREDVLLSSAVFGVGFLHTSAGINGSEKFLPDSSYEILLKGSARQSIALSPPYLLKAGSRGAVRFTFSSADGPIRAPIAFELYASDGAKIAAINGFFDK